jgi:hypothetical protein
MVDDPAMPVVVAIEGMRPMQTDTPAAAAVNGRPAMLAAVIAVLVFVAVLVAAGRWALREPLPTTPDEAHYLKYLLHDHDAYARGGLRKLAAAIIYDDRTRPPAYRLMVLPWVALLGPAFAHMRLLAMAWLCVAAALVAATVRRLTGSWPAGVLAAVAGCLATKVVLSTIHFGTEYATFVGTALVAFGLFRDWDRPTADARSLRWWPLALGLAISALAKASFAPLAVGPLLIVAAAWWAGWTRGPRPSYLLAAAGVALVLAGPWWAFNFGRALGFAKYSLQFQRRSFGAPGIGTSVAYLTSIARYEIGLPITLLIAAPLVAFTVLAVARRNRFGSTAAAVVALAIPPLLLIGLQMVSPNQDGRLVSNGFVPLAMAAVVAAAALGWFRSWIAPALAVVAVAVQAAMIAMPPETVTAVTARVPLLAVSLRPGLRPWPMCDWEPLRDICAAHGLPAPRVAVLGNANTFDSDQVEIPWARHGQAVRVDQLWRWDAGDYSADKVAADAARADVVITAPGLVGDELEHESRDNQYNAAFAARLTADPAYGPPAHLTVGGADPIAVDVFFRRSATTAR